MPGAGLGLAVRSIQACNRHPGSRHPRQQPPHLWHTKMTGRWPTPAAASFSMSWCTVCRNGSDSPCSIFMMGGWSKLAVNPPACKVGTQSTCLVVWEAVALHNVAAWWCIKAQTHQLHTPAPQHHSAHLPAAGGGGVLQAQQAGVRNLFGHPAGGPADGAVQALTGLIAQGSGDPLGSVCVKGTEGIHGRQVGTSEAQEDISKSINDKLRGSCAACKPPTWPCSGLPSHRQVAWQAAAQQLTKNLHKPADQAYAYTNQHKRQPWNVSVPHRPTSPPGRAPARPPSAMWQTRRRGCRARTQCPAAGHLHRPLSEWGGTRTPADEGHPEQSEQHKWHASAAGQQPRRVAVPYSDRATVEQTDLMHRLRCPPEPALRGGVPAGQTGAHRPSWRVGTGSILGKGSILPPF